MCTVTATEFKRNFGKYAQLSKSEEIVVTKKGSVLFVIKPSRIEALEKFDSLVGCLPETASIGVDPDERG